MFYIAVVLLIFGPLAGRLLQDYVHQVWWLPLIVMLLYSLAI